MQKSHQLDLTVQKVKLGIGKINILKISNGLKFGTCYSLCSPLYLLSSSILYYTTTAAVPLLGDVVLYYV
jgi:hypothetical protein